jgi:anti-sigma factor RsiW
MTESDSPVTEDELHAYVDGELPADRHEAVAAWLANHPEDAARVAAWRAQAEAIRARYGAVADEQPPERFRLSRLARPRRHWIAVATAAAIATFIAGGVAGWVARGASLPVASSFDRFTSEALDAHKLYVVEVRHPVEVPGSDRAHMVQWLSKRLGYDQQVPNLESIGLKLVGGRLLPGPTGAAALYMYEGGSGERYTIYCARVKSPETALRFKREDHAAAFYWVDRNAAYVVTGPGDRDRLQEVVDAIYAQIDQPSTTRRQS